MQPLFLNDACLLERSRCALWRKAHTMKRILTFLGALVAVFFSLGISNAAARESEIPRESVSFDRGLDLRASVGAATSWLNIRYDGPPDYTSEGNISDELHFSTAALVLGGDASVGIGYFDGRGNRYGLDAGAQLGRAVLGSNGLPYTTVTLVGLASLGPSYTRLLTPRLELDVSARGALLGFAGARADIGAYDNVIEFPAHVGFLGRVATAYRLSPGGITSLIGAVHGGAQFAENQTTVLLGATIGVQFN